MRLISNPANTFFLDNLLPVAETVKETGKRYFLAHSDCELPTYFRGPHRHDTTKAALETSGGADEVIEALEQLWRDGGDDELVCLIDALRTLRDDLAANGSAQSEEPIPSPQAYTLF